MNNTSGTKLIASNKKAYFDYFIEDTYEAGIILVGSEVKSIRLAQVNLKDSFCVIKEGRVKLYNMHISPYEKGSFFNLDAKRDRELLMHRAEINKIRGYVERKGYTVVPTKIYLKQGLVKVELGLAKGKELHDKRHTIAEKETNRQLNRELKQFNKY